MPVRTILPPRPRTVRKPGNVLPGKISVDQPEEFHLFWRGPLSNWAMTTFEIGGINYNCVEQYMMAEKARIFGDDGCLAAIMKSANPKEQKALGRNVRPYDDAVWAAARKEVVKRGCKAKLEQHPNILRLLLKTTGTVVEASPYDEIWGIKLGADDPRAKNRSTWRGLNLLGELLTELREEFRLQMQPSLFAP